MPDEPDNIVLIYLRRLDTKMDRLAQEMHDVKIRLTAVEEGLAGCNRRLIALTVVWNGSSGATILLRRLVW